VPFLGAGMSIAELVHTGAVRSIYIVGNGTANNNHVHELLLSGGIWRNADLTAIAGAPSLRSPGDIAFDPRWNITRVHYVGIDNHVHELFLAKSASSSTDCCSP
jgi:hypothetical protein